MAKVQKKKIWPIDQAAGFILDSLKAQNLKLYYTESSNGNCRPVLVSMIDGSLLDGAELFKKYTNQLAKFQEAISLSYGKNVCEYCLNSASALPGGRQAAVFVDNANTVYFVDGNRELGSSPVEDYLAEHAVCLPPKLRITFDKELYEQASMITERERWDLLPKSIQDYFGAHYETDKARGGLLQFYGYLLALPRDLRAFWVLCGERRTGKSEVVTLFRNLTQKNEPQKVTIPALSKQSLLGGDIETYDPENDERVEIELPIVRGSETFIAQMNFQHPEKKLDSDANYARRFCQDEYQGQNHRVDDDIIKRWGDPNASAQTVLIYEKPRPLTGGRCSFMLVNNPLVCSQAENVKDRIIYVCSFNPTSQKDQRPLYDPEAPKLSIATIEEISRFMTIAVASVMAVVKDRGKLFSEMPDEGRLRNEDNLHDPLLIWYGERFTDRSRLPEPPPFNAESTVWKSGVELSRDFRQWCEDHGYSPNGLNNKQYCNITNSLLMESAKISELDDAKLAFGPQSAFHQQVKRYNKNFIDSSRPHRGARIYYYYTGDYIPDTNADDIE